MDEKRIDMTEESKKSWAAPKLTCMSETHTLGGVVGPKPAGENLTYYS